MKTTLARLLAVAGIICFSIACLILFGQAIKAFALENPALNIISTLFIFSGIALPIVANKSNPRFYRGAQRLSLYLAGYCLGWHSAAFLVTPPLMHLEVITSLILLLVATVSNIIAYTSRCREEDLIREKYIISR